MSARACRLLAIAVRACRFLAIAACFALGGCHHSLPQPAGSDGGSDAGGTILDGGSVPDAGPVSVVIRTVFPDHGPAAGGTRALVSGSGFVQGFASRGGPAVSAQTSVTIGGAAATGVDVIDDNRLQLVTPAGAGGPADLVVTNPNGSGTCAGCFRFQPPLAVTAIAPATGPAAGGTPVTMTGVGFSSDMLLTIGGRAVVGLVVGDQHTATGFAPPGALGGADVMALNRDATATLERGYVYAAPLALDAITPAVGPTAGGTALTVAGEGFSAQAQVTLGGLPADTLWVDSHTLSAVAPAHAAGAVDVVVADPGALDGGSAALDGGYLYADDLGALALASVAPRHGPLDGGIALTLWGTGLDGPGLVVTVGGAAAAVTAQQATSATVTLPPGAAQGAVDVTATLPGGGASTLAGAFRYDAAVSIARVTPARGPAAGGTAISIGGAGFANVAGVRVGALPATAVQPAGDGLSISAVTPAGAPGPADVVVTLADGTAATLPGAFTFTAPLRAVQVAPQSGAQAGGEHALLYGQGFEAGLAVSFGSAASSVQLLGPGLADVVVPPGAPGAVDVTATLGAQSDRIPEGFTFFDPSSSAGGTSGAPLRGTLNVSVIEASAFKTGGVQDATVAVDFGGGGRAVLATDARGQVTLTDERLALPCQVTISKAQYNAITAADVQTDSLSVFLSGPAGPPPPPPNPPPPPPQPQRPATISGRVLGFKVPPSLQLGPSQRLAAYVYQALDSIYSAPPFGAAQKPQIITDDGGVWAMNTFRLEPTTIYAVFGVEDRSTTPATLTPLLLGIHRAILPNPDKPVGDADIILDTHLDQTIAATILAVPSTPRGAVAHDAAVDLDLGSDGVIPLAHLIQAAPLDKLQFQHLPAASGQGFVFVDTVGLYLNGAVSLPASIYLRRVFSDPGAGFTLGPLLPFPVMTTPPERGAFTPAGFAWSIDGPLQPNLVQLQVSGSSGLAWGAVLPATARGLKPTPELAPLFTTGTYSWSLTISLAPAFDFAHWTYGDLFNQSWTAYAFDSSSFTVGSP